MAINFRISIHRKSDDLSIQLAGDFDGSSAIELLNTLQEQLHGCACISIDTSKLKKIYPFGRDVFAHHLFKLKKHHKPLKLVGKLAHQIVPAEMEYLRIDQNHRDSLQDKGSLISIETEYAKRIDRV